MALATYENIANAAQQLIAQGKKPSVRSITEVLGGGSPNQILIHLREFSKNRPLAKISSIAVDDSIQSAVISQIEREIAKAAQENEDKMQELEADMQVIADTGVALEKALEEKSAALELAAQAHAALEQETALDNAVAEKAYAEQVAINKDLRDGLSAERGRLDQVQRSLTIAETKLEQQEKAEAAQSKEIERLRTLLDSAEKGKTTAEQLAAINATKLEAANHAATEQTKATAENVRILSHQIEQAEASVKALQKSLDASQLSAEQATKAHVQEREKLAQIAADARERAASAEAQLKALQPK